MNATTEITDKRIAQLITDTAYRAAKAYLAQHHLRADDIALASCVKAWCRIKLPEAITDYRQAAEIGMKQWGQQTFLATFTLAGIEAAKEAGLPA